MVRVIPLLLVLTVFGACKSASRTNDAAALMREANSLLAKSTESSTQWTTEYMKAFNPENRAQFPANRQSLKKSADNVIKSLDENSRISNEAIAKYEQATALITDEKQRRGSTMIVSALKTSVEMCGLFKSQMQLVSDEKVTDQKTFNDRFNQIARQIGEKGRENKAQFDEGRRLLGM
jgi:hypothetical protein